MGDIFKVITGGLSKFVVAWLLPSIVSLGLFSLFLWPNISSSLPFQPILRVVDNGPIAAGLVFAFFVLLISMSFAYSSLPIYRLLEGFTLPRVLRVRLQRRHIRRWHTLRTLEERAKTQGIALPGTLKERLDEYPVSRENIRATRLGNALTAMESFGTTRYGLDSQSLWYELQSVVPETTRKYTEDGRAPVDFFVSSIAHMTVLSLSSLVVGLVKGDPSLVIVGVAAALTLPLSYRLAVKNVKDWSGSVRALVNLGRRPLAQQMGLRMPQELVEERNMWASFLWAVERLDVDSVGFYDLYRIPPPPPNSIE